MKNTWYINIICTKFTSQNVSYVPSLLHKLNVNDIENLNRFSLGDKVFTQKALDFSSAFSYNLLRK